MKIIAVWSPMQAVRLLVLLWPLLAPGQAAFAIPAISTQPTNQSVTSGASASFTVAANGSSLTYQWRHNDANLPQATNAILSLTSVQVRDAGAYAVEVRDNSGAVTSQVAVLTIDAHLTFKVTGLATNGFIAFEHSGLTGDDRGGIAVSGTQVFYTGDNSTARWNIEYLNGGTTLSTRFDALVSDLRTATVYSLANGTTALTSPGGTANSLLEHNGATGALTGNRIDLSASIALNNNQNIGIFAGFGRIVLHDGTRAYDVALPSGVVTDLGEVFIPQHANTENWAYWGLAEYIGGAIHLVYVRDNQSIVRTRVTDGATSVAASFENLSDMAAISFSVAFSRWFFHHEGTSQFNSADETIGSAKAFYTTNPGYPAILREPQGQSSFPGGTVTFTVLATGGEPLTYQWRVNGQAIAGVNGPTLMLTNIQPGDAGNYDVEVSNAFGAVTSLEAVLQVFTVPTIVADPSGQATYPGGSASFSVSVVGAPPLSYQWRYNGTSINGATNDTLSLSNIAPASAGNYSVRVSNTYGSATSADATLDVITVPFVLIDPQGQTVAQGAAATFSVLADGAPPLRYQWFFNNATIAGATNDTLLLTNVTPALAGLYGVRVTNIYGATTSAVAVLTVLGAPEILTQPASQSVFPGQSTSFSVSVSGATPLRFQWLLNGNIVTNATSATLNLNNIQTNQAGLYSVRVTNQFGAVISSSALLTVIFFEDDGSVFRIASLQTNNPRTALTGPILGGNYERGPIAVSASNVFFSGPTFSARANAETLTGLASVGRYYGGLCANLRTENVYALGNGTNVIGEGGGTVTTLLELNGLTGALTNRSVTLSSSIPATESGGQVGIYSGYDRIVIHNGSRVYNIALPSGTVSDFGPLSSPTHPFSFGWAYGGIAEHFGGVVHLVYAQNSTTIVRRSVATGTITTVTNFLNLSPYMNALGASIARGRWYFHHLLASQFGNNNNDNNLLGYAPATFTINSGQNIDHFDFAPINALQVVNVPFTVTLTARTTGGTLASNYTGTAFLTGRHITSGALVSISPASVTLTNGVATGPVTVSVGSPGMTLRADDRNGNLGASAPFSVSPLNDLVVSVTDAPDPVLLGSNLTYVVTVTNIGPTTATAVTITNTLPPTVTLVSVATTQGSCTTNGNVIRCALGSVATGATVTIVVVPPAPGLITNRVAIGRGESDPNAANNAATNVTTVTLPALFVSGATVAEGNSGTNALLFTVSLDPAATNTVTVNYATANGTAISAGANADYVSISGQLTFLAGETNKTISVSIRGDTTFETNETFFVNLSNPVNATTNNNQANGLILNDDQPPTVSVTDVTITEGNSGTNNAVFRVGLSATSGVGIQVPYSTANGTARSVTDYIARSGVLNFTPNTATLTQTLTISVLGDTVVEPNEVFYLNLLGATNATLMNTQGVCTILADDGIGVVEHFVFDPVASPQRTNEPFTVTVTAKDVFETTISNFTGTVTLSGLFGTPPVQDRIVGDLAATNTGTGDYTLGFAFTPTNDLRVTHVRHYSGTKVSIWTSGGALLASRNVTSTPGTWVETPLTEPLLLPAGSTYVVAAYTGGGSGSYFFETNPTTNFNHGLLGRNLFNSGDTFPTQEPGALFLVDLVYETGAPPAPVPVSPTMSGNFVDGVWTGVIAVEQARTNMQLRATDAAQHTGLSNPFDAVPVTVVLPALAISGATLAEGNSGTNDLMFTVSLDPASANTVIVNYATANGTALSAGANADYVSTSGQLTFLAGETNKTISVGIRGDTTYETNETFFVNLSNPVNATTNNSQGIGLILNDDQPPTVSVTDVTITEGNSGTNNAVFRVGLSATSGVGIQVPYATANGTAVAGSDYIARSGVLNFTPNTATLTQTLTISVLGDTVVEPNEVFYLILLGATNATLMNTQGVCTILADDGIGVLDHFVFDPIASPQPAYTPFAITVTAKDVSETTISNFTGTVSLSGLVGSPSVPVPVLPTVSANFVAGVWTGVIAVEQVATNLQLQATDAAQHTGLSNPFDAVSGSDADLSLAVVAAPSPAPFTSNVTFAVTITNRGPHDASSVILSNQLPVGAALLSVQFSQGGCTNGNGWISCDLGSLTNGGGATVSFAVQPAASGTLSNFVAITAVEPDSAPGNNAAATLVTVCTDCDGDGLPNDWEWLYGLNAMDSADAAWDGDNDGALNWEEYVAGTSPVDAASVLRIVRIQRSGADVEIAFDAVAGKRYRLERLDGMAGAAWSGMVDFRVSQKTTVELLDTGAAGHLSRFYRIRVLP